MGYNKMAQQGFENNLQRQQLEDRRRIYEAQIARDEEAAQQRDFRNSLDLAKYNQLGNYRNASLGQRDASLSERSQYHAGGLEERKAVRQQREQLFQQKVRAGVDTREDWQQNQAERDAIAAEYASERQGVGIDAAAARQKAAHEHADNILQQRLAGHMGRADMGPNNAQMARLKQHLVVLSSQLNAVNSQDSNALTARAKADQEAKKQVIKNQQSMVLDELDRLNITGIGAQAPIGQPSQADPLNEAGSNNAPSQPLGVQSNESGYYVGQIIPTPKGSVKVVGFDSDQMPMVNPVGG